MSLYFVSLILTIRCSGSSPTWQLIENNNDQNATYQQLGSWKSWMTGYYHVNDAHDGYLDISSTLFNASNLDLKWSVNTNCSSAQSLFANGRIYCTSNNILQSFNPYDGSISFSYLNVDLTIKGATFTSFQEFDKSIFLYSYSASKLYITLFDAMTGKIKENTAHLPVYDNYYSTYSVGTPYGQTYITSKNSSSTLVNSSINSYNIRRNEFINSPMLVQGYGETPVMCNNLTIVSGYKGDTNAFLRAPVFKHQWYWSRYGSTSIDVAPWQPVCIRSPNNKKYKVIIKPFGLSTFGCFLLDAITGKLLDEFDCGTMPIIHYNDLGNADVIIMGTYVMGQIAAFGIKYGHIVNPELWTNEGDVDTGFMVKNYFITGSYSKPILNSSYYSIYVKIYDIYNGDIVWNTEVDVGSERITYSVFGGLYEPGIGQPVQFMLIIRIGNTMYSYTEKV